MVSIKQAVDNHVLDMILYYEDRISLFNQSMIR
jgi:hypothetical protein